MSKLTRAIEGIEKLTHNPNVYLALANQGGDWTLKSYLTKINKDIHAIINELERIKIIEVERP